jgi:hypothetical protein
MLTAVRFLRDRTTRARMLGSGRSRRTAGEELLSVSRHSARTEVACRAHARDPRVSEVDGRRRGAAASQCEANRVPMPTRKRPAASHAAHADVETVSPPAQKKTVPSSLGVGARADIVSHDLICETCYSLPLSSLILLRRYLVCPRGCSFNYMETTRATALGLYLG